MKIFIIEKNTLTIRTLVVARFDPSCYDGDVIPHADELAAYIELDNLIEEKIAVFDAEAKDVYIKKLAAGDRIEEIKNR